jgi:hypothetical protein
VNVAAGYIRRNHEVEAVQVTFEMFRDIAEWCGGAIRSLRDEGTGELYIRVPIVRSKYANKPNKAFVGDWILKDGDGFKVYSDKAFQNSYKPLIPDSGKLEAVLKLVKFAMLEQDSATYHGRSGDMGEIAKQVAAKIMEIV